MHKHIHIHEKKYTTPRAVIVNLLKKQFLFHIKRKFIIIISDFVHLYTVIYTFT